MQEAEAMALLVSAQGVGYLARERALSQAGSALRVMQEPQAYAAQLGENGVAAVRRSMRDAQRQLDHLRAERVQLVVRGGEGYPKRLEETARAPHVLFVWGRADLCDACPFAIVGTRRASAYGLRHTRAIARELAQAGVCVVSGLALGIDSAGHMGALDAGGRTIAVLGGALNRLYPAENEKLMRQIIEQNGSVVTEYPLDVPPGKYTFLLRNRIIAGMSLGVLVTEGPLRSGAMRTAQDALDAGREVFALPGDVDRVNAQLPNRLIAEGAHLAGCAKDILDELVVEEEGARAREPAAKTRRPAKNAQPGTKPKAAQGVLSEPERMICQALLAEEMDFDALCMKTGISSEELGALLMMMELDGRVEALAGKRYRLCSEGGI